MLTEKGCIQIAVADFFEYTHQLNTLSAWNGSVKPLCQISNPVAMLAPV